MSCRERTDDSRVLRGLCVVVVVLSDASHDGSHVVLPPRPPTVSHPVAVSEGEHASEGRVGARYSGFESRVRGVTMVSVHRTSEKHATKKVNPEILVVRGIGGRWEGETVRAHMQASIARLRRRASNRSCCVDAADVTLAGPHRAESGTFGMKDAGHEGAMLRNSRTDGCDVIYKEGVVPAREEVKGLPIAERCTLLRADDIALDGSGRSPGRREPWRTVHCSRGARATFATPTLGLSRSPCSLKWRYVCVISVPCWVLVHDTGPLPESELLLRPFQLD